MSTFVDECRKEWKRLGVPEADANEMASDLTADLAEAEADGVSPEEVLGNGAFDARSFAASWATARGFAHVVARDFPSKSRPLWRYVASTAACLLLSLIGLLVITTHAILRRSVDVATTRTGVIRLPKGIVLVPGRFPSISRFPGHAQVAINTALAGPNNPLGWVVLSIGLIGLGVTLWLWRPWSTPRKPKGDFDDKVQLPSYL